MATLPQRFKLLATRCAAGAPSPSRSPAPAFAASPGYGLRRRRGQAGRRRSAGGGGGGGRLRRLLCRRWPEPARPQEDDKKPLVGRGGRTLRDLFVASPEAARRGRRVDDGEEDGEEGAIGSGRAAPGAGGAAGRRFGAGGLRSLLMRRSWRPVLVAIPEGDGGGKIDLAAIEE